MYSIFFIIHSSLYGVYGSNKWESTEKRIQFSGYINHEKYDPFLFKYDIGVLFINGKLTRSEKWNIIPLNSEWIGAGHESYVTGWGRLWVCNISTSHNDRKCCLGTLKIMVDTTRFCCRLIGTINLFKSANRDRKNAIKSYPRSSVTFFSLGFQLGTIFDQELSSSELGTYPCKTSAYLR